MTDPWAFVDAVYCITLDTATHRHPVVQKELEKVGLWQKTSLQVNQRDPRGGVCGCHESHRKVWDLAKQKGLRNVMVVEDDVFFANDWHQYVKDAEAFVQGEPDWDCLFLGWTPIRSKKTKWKNIVEIMCGTAMHAYIVNRRALETGLPAYEVNKVPVDNLIMCPQCHPKDPGKPASKCVRHRNPKFRMFTVHPMIAFQRYDRTSSTGNSDAANKRKANVKLMRFFAATTTTTDLAKTVMIMSLTGLVLVAGVVATAVAVPLTRSNASLTGGGQNTTFLVAVLVLGSLLACMCCSVAYTGRGVKFIVRHRALKTV